MAENKMGPVAELKEEHKEITGKDNAPMILVSAGEFLMGSTAGEIDLRWEHPKHKVFLDTYY